MDEMQERLFTTVKLEDFVPADHPLRPLRLLVNQALKRLNGLFSTIYADNGRVDCTGLAVRCCCKCLFGAQRAHADGADALQPAVPLVRPGWRSKTPSWDHSVFSKNRDRLLEHEVVEAFYRSHELGRQARAAVREHFSVDGTLIQAWASHKSFRPKDGSDDPPAGGGQCRHRLEGKRRSNETLRVEHRFGRAAV
ncbi:hypothetical protein AAFM48_16935 [Burkholderia pseudomallei]